MESIYTYSWCTQSFKINNFLGRSRVDKVYPFIHSYLYPHLSLNLPNYLSVSMPFMYYSSLSLPPFFLRHATFSLVVCGTTTVGKDTCKTWSISRSSSRHAKSRGTRKVLPAQYQYQ